MKWARIAFLISGLALSIAVGCGGSELPEGTVTDWRYDGSTYEVVSGVAGDLPEFWVERGWTAGGVLVYLSDQQITCDDFPTEVVDEFPPRPTVDGATIWLKLTEKGTAAALDYASFDIVASVDNPGDTASGVGTDAVTASLTALEGGRVQGWLEYTSTQDDTGPQVDVSGTFDVPFCG